MCENILNKHLQPSLNTKEKLTVFLNNVNKQIAEVQRVVGETSI